MFATKVNDSITPTCCFTSSELGDYCCATIDSKSKTDDSLFVESVIYPGEKLIYKNEGHNAIVKINTHRLDKDGMLVYDIEFPDGETQEVPREFLSRPDNPDIASLPTRLPELREAVRQLSTKDCEAIMNPKPLSPAA